MTTAEFHALIAAVCPIQSVDSAGGIVFDPSATPSQQQQAQSVAAANLPKLNGQPTRIPLGYVQTYQQIQTLYGSNQPLALKYLCAWVAWVTVNNPSVAADINSKLGTSIGYDQANPNG